MSLADELMRKILEYLDRSTSHGAEIKKLKTRVAALETLENKMKFIIEEREGE
jgi:uncharacterized protein (DUF1778 family)